MQGADDEVIEALSRGELPAGLPEHERGLLEFVKTLTLHAYRTSNESVEQLRELGWTDEQLAETVFVSGMFAMFNRVSDAFGLQDPGYRQLAREGKVSVRPAERFQ